MRRSHDTACPVTADVCFGARGPLAAAHQPHGGPRERTIDCSGLDGLWRSPIYQISNAFGGSVDSAVRLPPVRTRADGSGRLQEHIYGAANSIGGALSFNLPEDHSNASYHACMSCERREQSIFSVSTSLGCGQSAVVNDLNAHGFGRANERPLVPGRPTDAAGDRLVWPALILRTRRAPNARENERRSGRVPFRNEGCRFRMKWEPAAYATRPYCFILRQRVTVLILRASAASFRFPRKRSSARSIVARSCAWRSRLSSSGAR